jgi:hypothetical protein
LDKNRIEHISRYGGTPGTTDRGYCVVNAVINGRIWSCQCAPTLPFNPRRFSKRISTGNFIAVRHPTCKTYDSMIALLCQAADNAGALQPGRFEYAEGAPL